MGNNTVLFGREREVSYLRDVLHSADAGAGSALVLHGAPGAGKSELLRYVADRAVGFQVLRCVGMRAESEFGFAALHELLVPVIDRLTTLPPPHTRALATALGRHPGSANRFEVGIALVELLSVLGTEGPLLLVVED